MRPHQRPGATNTAEPRKSIPEDPVRRLVDLAVELAASTAPRRTTINYLVGAAATAEELESAARHPIHDDKARDERAQHALRMAGRMWTPRAHRDARNHCLDLTD